MRGRTQKLTLELNCAAHQITDNYFTTEKQVKDVIRVRNTSKTALLLDETDTHPHHTYMYPLVHPSPLGHKIDPLLPWSCRCMPGFDQGAPTSMWAHVALQLLPWRAVTGVTVALTVVPPGKDPPQRRSASGCHGGQAPVLRCLCTCLGKRSQNRRGFTSTGRQEAKVHVRGNS